MGVTVGGTTVGVAVSVTVGVLVGIGVLVAVVVGAGALSHPDCPGSRCRPTSSKTMPDMSSIIICVVRKLGHRSSIVIVSNQWAATRRATHVSIVINLGHERLPQTFWYLIRAQGFGVSPDGR